MRRIWCWENLVVSAILQQCLCQGYRSCINSWLGSFWKGLQSRNRRKRGERNQITALGYWWNGKSCVNYVKLLQIFRSGHSCLCIGQPWFFSHFIPTSFGYRHIRGKCKNIPVSIIWNDFRTHTYNYNIYVCFGKLFKLISNYNVLFSTLAAATNTTSNQESRFPIPTLKLCANNAIILFLECTKHHAKLEKELKKCSLILQNSWLEQTGK